MAYEYGNYRVVSRREEPNALPHWGDFQHAIQHRPRLAWEAIGAFLLLTDAITAAKALREADERRAEMDAFLAAELEEGAE